MFLRNKVLLLLSADCLYRMLHKLFIVFIVNLLGRAVCTKRSGGTRCVGGIDQ